MERSSTIESQLVLNNQIGIANTTATNINPVYKKTQTILLKNYYSTNDIEVPLSEQRKKVFELEKQLFESINLKWNENIISEDIPIIDDDHNDYYMHLVRTAHPDPNKENFLLIHGFLSSGLHFFGLLPYLIKRYNVFIPDTIGMGLSSRPQVKFTSPIQCESYFIGIYHLFIKSLFFENRFNIKKEYYLCGHSLGGFLMSRYMLLYPEGIKKVLLLSPAGITDYRIPGTDFFRDSTAKFFCSAVCCTTLVWPCQLRVQNLYNCCCCHNLIRNHYGIVDLNIDKDEIKKNPDGSEFEIDFIKLKAAIAELTVISLDYPSDLYKCAYYMFAPPPPAAILPVEQKIRDYNKLDVIICFGEYDWMDKIGAYRLQKFNPDRYKVFTISKGGHSFALNNPKEVCSIIEQYFRD